MKEIIYEDCNNNIQFIKEMFLKIGLMVKEELMWNISNFDSVPVNSEDIVVLEELLMTVGREFIYFNKEF